MLADQELAVERIEKAMGDLMKTCGKNDLMEVKTLVHNAWRSLGEARTALLLPQVSAGLASMAAQGRRAAAQNLDMGNAAITVGSLPAVIVPQGGRNG